MLARHIYALMLGTFVLGMARFGTMAILDNIAQDLQITIPEAGHAITAYAIGVVSGVFLMIAFGRNLAMHHLLYLLGAVMFIGNALTFWIPSYEGVVVSRWIAGLPHGAFFGAGGVLCTQLAQKGYAARDISLMVLGMTIANLAGIPLASYIAYQWHWRDVYLGTSVLAGLLCVLLFFFIPRQEKKEAIPFRKQFQFLTELRPWLVLFLIFLGNSAFFSFHSYIQPIMLVDAKIAPEYLSFIMMLIGFGMVSGNLLCSKIAHRYSPIELIRWGQWTLLASLLVVFFFSDVTPLTVIAGMGIVGVAFFVTSPLQLLMIEGAGDGKMLGGALAQSSFNLGNAAGAAFGGIPLAYGFAPHYSTSVGIFFASLAIGIVYLLGWIYRTRSLHH